MLNGTPQCIYFQSFILSGLTIVMKTMNFNVLTNRTALLLSRNAENNLKTIAKAIVYAANYVEICFTFIVTSV